MLDCEGDVVCHESGMLDIMEDVGKETLWPCVADSSNSLSIRMPHFTINKDRERERDLIKAPFIFCLFVHVCFCLFFWFSVAFGLFYSSFFGIVSNLVIYLVQIWGETSAHAANSVTNLTGTAFVCSFLGAFTSDAYLGRLWTAIVFQILCLLVSTHTQQISSKHENLIGTNF